MGSGKGEGGEEMMRTQTFTAFTAFSEQMVMLQASPFTLCLLTYYCSLQAFGVHINS